MISKYILRFDQAQADLQLLGGKGASLSRLIEGGVPVPGGFHITTHAYREFISRNDIQPEIDSLLVGADAADPAQIERISAKIRTVFEQGQILDEIAVEIAGAYHELAGGDALSVAVRSSATAEDLPDASFAGQQETYLNVSGEQALLRAVKDCWASLWTARAISYRFENQISNQDVALAVVVQEMVFADASGVLFTANPLNGSREEAVINAVWGLGEALVSGQVTPDHYVLYRQSGKILDKQIAEKNKMSVRSAQGVSEQAVPRGMRARAVLSDQQARELVDLALRIEELYKIPLDIEWVLSKGKFSIVQARQVTALPQAVLPVPDEWKLPKGMYAAARNNIVEFMTEPLTPLFRTLGLEAVNSSMKRTMESFFGASSPMANEMIITVNQYAYYNGSVKFWPMIKILFSMRRIMKRMFTGAVERWTEGERPKYVQQVRDWESKDWRSLSSSEIILAVRELSEAAIDAYMALVSGVIPAAWMSEAWFTWNYRFVKKKDDPEAPRFLMGFNSLPIRSEKALFDLAKWVNMQPDLRLYLFQQETVEIIRQLEEGHAPEVDGQTWHEFQERFEEYLSSFGAMIYNLDFGNPVPADDPAPLLETLKLFLSGEGSDPHLRQQEAETRRIEAVESIRSRIKGVRLRLFNRQLERAQRYAPLREDGLAEVGLSYPLMRKMLFELGERFTKAKVIETPQDIFWMEGEECRLAAEKLDQGLTPLSRVEAVKDRKLGHEAARKAVPPLMLPQMKLFGKDLMELKTGKSGKGSQLKGVAASAGKVRARACVLHSPGDFEQMRTGDVLVASLTTPAWTPLFARAAAIVTDIGGPLSHGSIVAREYGIPAVLGSKEATKRIKTGQMITVDGSLGIVYLSED